MLNKSYRWVWHAKIKTFMSGTWSEIRESFLPRKFPTIWYVYPLFYWSIFNEQFVTKPWNLIPLKLIYQMVLVSAKVAMHVGIEYTRSCSLTSSPFFISTHTWIFYILHRIHEQMDNSILASKKLYFRPIVEVFSDMQSGLWVHLPEDYFMLSLITYEM